MQSACHHTMQPSIFCFDLLFPLFLRNNSFFSWCSKSEALVIDLISLHFQTLISCVFLLFGSEHFQILVGMFSLTHVLFVNFCSGSGCCRLSSSLHWFLV